MILEVEKENVNDIVIGKKEKGPSLFSRCGRFMATVSLIAGVLALLFSVAPYFSVWSAFVFWLLYPLSALSLLTSIPAYLGHQIWRPTLGIVFSLCSIVVAMLSGEIYVLGMAGSVNEMTATAKMFVDALKWPF